MSNGNIPRLGGQIKTFILRNNPEDPDRTLFSAKAKDGKFDTLAEAIAYTTRPQASDDLHPNQFDEFIRNNERQV